jgi:WD40 repeat protein
MLGHLNSIKDIAVSPQLSNNSAYIASASQDYNIRVWSLKPLLNETKDEGDWAKLYETKTSYVIRLPDEVYYQVSLESVIQHH